MQQRNRIGLAALAIAFGGSATAHAQLVCGDTVASGARVVLAADVGPCDDETGGITVIGPATLDLNGHRLECADLDDDDTRAVGIRVEGEKAVVRGGQIEACAVGVQVAGAGRHRVKEMSSLANVIGYQVLSSRNRLERNDAAETLDRGIELQGGENLLVRNVVSSGEVGIEIRSSDNRLTANEASECTADGFRIAAIDAATGAPTSRNKLARSSAAENLVGFRIAGERHTLVRNRAVGNDFMGFTLDDGKRHLLRRNEASDNGTHGFYLTDDSIENRLMANRAERNGQNGIRVGLPGAGPSSGNLFLRNLARDNGFADGGFSDLFDVAPSCGTNVWQSNRSGTAQPAVCIE